MLVALALLLPWRPSSDGFVEYSATAARATAAPTVSIVMPTHNRSRLLPHACAMVAAQTRADLELLVLDDTPGASGAKRWRALEGTEGASALGATALLPRPAPACEGRAEAQPAGTSLRRGEFVRGWTTTTTSCRRASRTRSRRSICPPRPPDEHSSAAASPISSRTASSCARAAARAVPPEHDGLPPPAHVGCGYADEDFWRMRPSAPGRCQGASGQIGQGSRLVRTPGAPPAPRERRRAARRGPDLVRQRRRRREPRWVARVSETDVMGDGAASRAPGR